MGKDLPQVEMRGQGGCWGSLEGSPLTMEGGETRPGRCQHRPYLYHHPLSYICSGEVHFLQLIHEGLEDLIPLLLPNSQEDICTVFSPLSLLLMHLWRNIDCWDRSFHGGHVSLHIAHVMVDKVESIPYCIVDILNITLHIYDISRSSYSTVDIGPSTCHVGQSTK